MTQSAAAPAPTPAPTPGLPLPLIRRGKVRELYALDADRLLLVASDRISALDVVLREPIPGKGRVLTMLSAWWFERLGGIAPSHFISADIDYIVERHRALAPHRSELAGRTMLVRCTDPIRFECVVRGYLAGSAWAEYRDHGTLAGQPLPAGLEESQRLATPLFSPAAKADAGHDENITFEALAGSVGEHRARELERVSLALYQAAVERARGARPGTGTIIADTKFEFGVDREGRLLLIDEVFTPDSSRFWPAERYRPGGPQPSFDKQPVRDYLAALQHDGLWDGQDPPPALPREVVGATARRYRDIYQRLTGQPLEEE